jgi:hypothetical protein
VSVASVAFVPAAPLLVPAVAGGSAELEAGLRAACLDVVAQTVARGPDEVVVVATVPSATASAGEWSGRSTWDFAGFGVARVPSDPRPKLPWPLGIGAWLLDEVGWGGPRRYVGVAADGVDGAAPSPGLFVGATSIIVVGDGSARRSERAPGHLHAHAEAFDAAVADLLGRGDITGLCGLDDTLAAELMCSGLPVWRWLIAALDGALVADAELLAHTAPYGVGYFVARWSFGQTQER